MLVIVLLALVTGLVIALSYGAHRWRADTLLLRTQLERAREPVRPRTVDFRELEGLPLPVQRYFRAVLREGAPMVAGVRVHHRGTFNMGEVADQWKPFTSEQKVVIRRPGFDWDARIILVPGLSVRVHDAYVAGKGILRASMFGLFPLVNLRGTGDLAEGELMRFFAEAAWYPTALLPSQGVRWRAVNDHSAYGTLSDDAITLTMLFSFDEQGLIDAVHAQARGRIVKGKSIPTPWQGRFWNYQESNGMRVPLDGEVEWLLPEGPKPYWRGRITDFVYEPP